MEDQVNYLDSTRVSAKAIRDTDDPEVIKQVMNGNYVVFYGFPECMLLS